jgi:uncharacterized protein
MNWWYNIGKDVQKEKVISMLSKEYILQELSHHLPVFTTKYGVVRMGLFGSYASNEQTESSDIDILVEFQPKAITFDHYMDLKIFLEDTFDSPVDLVINEDIKPALRPYIMGNVKYV